MFYILPSRNERKADGALAPPNESPLGLMRQEFPTLFDRFFGGRSVPLEFVYETPTFRGLEIEDAANEFVIKAEMPGFEPAEIEILVTGNTLTIKAEHKAKVKGKEEEEVVERRVDREVALPVGTEKERLEARYHNGVLEVHLPKTPEVKPRRIEVKT